MPDNGCFDLTPRRHTHDHDHPAGLGGTLWPPHLLDYLMNRLVEGAPFSESLTRFATSAASVVFPTTAPDAGTWLHEGELIPSVGLNPEHDVVAVCALKSLHRIPNEALNDTSYPLLSQVGRKLGDADGPKLDRALIYGQGQREPVGVWPKAPAADEAATFRGAVLRAWSELLSVGARRASVKVFVHPFRLGEEWGVMGDDGHPVHGDVAGDTQLFIGPGIPVTPIPVIEEDHVLAVDTSNVFFIVREALTIESSASGDNAWQYDSRSIRVRLRAAVGAPMPEKSLRRCTIAGALLAAKATTPPAKK